ncbi:response regulator [Candidatus Izemoplasma sp. B36]|uniref:response regulator n=1 Tax=Candidatus Izemoplasma sp. B36 TaxID=3242468 RepID=UPI0035562A23
MIDHMDTFILDENTETFNEFFLREYLINFININSLKPSDRNPILMVINIDDISDINARYSNDEGDETIKNLGYLINQVKSDDQLLFKRKGPGYILFLHDFKGKSIKDYASVFQNKVKSSEAFIEAITVSIAVVKFSEIDTEMDVQEKADILISKCNSRINKSSELYSNAYISDDKPVALKSLGKVLVVESDELLLKILKMSLEKQDYQVTAVSDGVTALNSAKKYLYDAIIADRYSHKIDGLRFKQYLNESSINMNTLFIMTVNNKTVNIVEKANLLNINYILEKPIIFEEAYGIISRELIRKKYSNR